MVVRNDIMDKEYNSFVIDQLQNSMGQISFRQTIKPGEEVVLKQSGITSLRLTRKYADHSKVYVVNCPAKLSSRVRLKLIDVHLNKLSGGCVLAKRGYMNEGGYIKWEQGE
ncbi:MAG: hypothetical protein IT292_08380 [Deltaproteobacteria bacterium]|nr:hypothetical protein [Deltaproteobacteria bacterium]